jgi:hypothetical protein
MTAAQLDFEETAVKFEGRLDVGHFEGNVIDPHGPRFVTCFIRHGILLSVNFLAVDPVGAASAANNRAYRRSHI